MSLPNGFLDELRNRVTLSQIVGRKVSWDTRRSNMGKGDWWAPCPFHQEKSASFHVDDRKGFYYCFGCQAKGDAISFLKESENMSFMEAVERLAQEAGMQMPAYTPQNAERADRRSKLAQIMEEAVSWFRLQLKTTAGADARAYLERRGLSSAAQERWEIGFAPDERRHLFEAFRQKGVDEDSLLDCGLCAKSDTGDIYDRFRGRIIFPIRDARGRAISFGGRALAANARAKYLNGPETVLFDKGRQLFNLGKARDALGKGHPLIVAEGYMDVIALSEAGFPASIAPLGTSITDAQLQAMWRVADEPIIALDGDSAGLRAALRVADLALPLLEAGKGLRFASLPTGLDPDDLLRQQGPKAMRDIINNALPMIRLLWQRETDGKIFDSPERRAALDKSLRSLVQKIRDPSLRRHYGAEMAQQRATLFGTGSSPIRKNAGQYRNNRRRPGAWDPSPWGARGTWPPVLSPPLSSTKHSFLAHPHFMTRQDAPREAVILACCLRYPALIAEVEISLAQLDFCDPTHTKLRDALLFWTEHSTDLTSDTLRDWLLDKDPDTLKTFDDSPFVRNNPSLQKKYDIAYIRSLLSAELIELEAKKRLHLEKNEAEADIERQEDVERTLWRLEQANTSRERASKGSLHAPTDVVIAENGVEMNREEIENAREIFSSVMKQSQDTLKKNGNRN